jgi:hypothetical protein
VASRVAASVETYALRGAPGTPFAGVLHTPGMTVFVDLPEVKVRLEITLDTVQAVTGVVGDWMSGGRIIQVPVPPVRKLVNLGRLASVTVSATETPIGADWTRLTVEMLGQIHSGSPD